MHKSRSHMSFDEFTCKKRDLYNFGNDWGLFIDIERNYRKMYFKKKQWMGGIYIVQVDYNNDNNDNNDSNNNGKFYNHNNNNIGSYDIENNLNEMNNIECAHIEICELFAKTKQIILSNVMKYSITFTAVSILTFCILFVL